jgi:hypothetical protein
MGDWLCQNLLSKKGRQAVEISAFPELSRMHTGLVQWLIDMDTKKEKRNIQNNEM